MSALEGCTEGIESWGERQLWAVFVAMIGGWQRDAATAPMAAESPKYRMLQVAQTSTKDYSA